MASWDLGVNFYTTSCDLGVHFYLASWDLGVGVYPAPQTPLYFLACAGDSFVLGKVQPSIMCSTYF